MFASGIFSGSQITTIKTPDLHWSTNTIAVCDQPFAYEMNNLHEQYKFGLRHFTKAICDSKQKLQWSTEDMPD